MDEAMIRERITAALVEKEYCEPIEVMEADIDIYRAAYADGQRDGMERAADRIVKTHKSTDSDKWLDLASELKTQAAEGAEIRQAAGGEVTGG